MYIRLWVVRSLTGPFRILGATAYALGFPLTTLVSSHATWPSFSRVVVFSAIHAKRSQKIVGRRGAHILTHPAFHTAKPHGYISCSSCESPSVGFRKDCPERDACFQ